MNKKQINDFFFILPLFVVGNRDLKMTKLKIIKQCR